MKPGDGLYTAIEIDIQEALACMIMDITLYYEYTHEYASVIVHLVGITCIIIEGKPEEKEQAELRWLKRESLASLEWTPVDIPALEKLMNEK
ncbi:hypothetical protein [Radiobacillus sp. PE A8.2]|uniref:hypothetical protein n=1 Tax=Radiobacillus sp. PE A8.2 TaxID=3380349 RepID=UPI00389053C3